MLCLAPRGEDLSTSPKQHILFCQGHMQHSLHEKCLTWYLQKGPLKVAFFGALEGICCLQKFCLKFWHPHGPLWVTWEASYIGSMTESAAASCKDCTLLASTGNVYLPPQPDFAHADRPSSHTQGLLEDLCTDYITGPPNYRMVNSWRIRRSKKKKEEKKNTLTAYLLFQENRKGADVQALR